MGSCLSNSRTCNANESFDGFYTRPKTEKDADKRRSCCSNSSSGIFSMDTSPSLKRNQCTNNSSYGNITNPLNCEGKLPKETKESPNKSLSTKEFNRMAIVDGIGELQLRDRINNQSRGYFTKSISSQSGDDVEDVSISNCRSNVVYTRDMSQKFQENATSVDGDDTESNCEDVDSVVGCSLEMEMYMLSTARGIIGKTSSPKPQRARGFTYVEHTAANLKRHSDSYNIWCHFLENTPMSMMQNVTHIPEAMAGRFCPSEFPAFINVQNEQSNEAKRFKFDSEECGPEIGHMNTTELMTPRHRGPIMTTEL